MNQVSTTKQERDLLKHSLGLDYNRKSFRNYFNAEPGHSEMPIIQSLITKGLMKQNPRDSNYFHVTDKGIEEVS
jgi:hypothetical protein